MIVDHHGNRPGEKEAQTVGLERRRGWGQLMSHLLLEGRVVIRLVETEDLIGGRDKMCL